MTEAVREEASTIAAPAEPKDRSISPITGGFGLERSGKIVTMVALLAGCGIFLAATWKHGSPKAPSGPLEPARQVVNYEPAKVDSPATAAPPTLANPGVSAPILDPVLQGAGGPEVPAIQPLVGQQPGQTQVAQVQAAQMRAAEAAAIRSAPILAYSLSGAAAPLPTLAPAPAQTTTAETATELDQLRRSSVIGSARATRLPDRHFLVAAGTSIPCTLLTAMDTSTPGYVSCLIGQDIYSDDGTVVLLEKGSKVLGEYRSGMKQAQRRLFVLWTRAATPGGVAIGLASPGSDALGRSGFDGAVDAHFWERFGGALLLSVVDDTSAAVASRNNLNGETIRAPSDASAVALQNSINIPASLKKKQGAQVSIFVAQDLDFSRVYGLRAR